jgi:hypothetical protein
MTTGIHTHIVEDTAIFWCSRHDSRLPSSVRIGLYEYTFEYELPPDPNYPDLRRGFYRRDTTKVAHDDLAMTEILGTILSEGLRGLRGIWEPDNRNIQLSIKAENYELYFGKHKCAANNGNCGKDAVVWSISDDLVPDGPGGESAAGGYVCHEHWSMFPDIVRQWETRDDLSSNMNACMYAVQYLVRSP